MALRISTLGAQGIVRVQSKTATTAATAAATLTLTFDAAPTPGNLVVIAIGQNLATQMLVTEANCVPVYVAKFGTNNPNTTIAAFRVFSGAAAAFAIATSSGNTANISAVGVEYSGVAYRPDKYADNSGSSTSPSSGTTGTTSNANELLLATLCNRNTNAGTVYSSPTNSFAIVAQTNTSTGTANTDRACVLLERIVTGTGTYSAGATSSVNSNWTGLILTFEETPLAPPNAFS